MNDRVKKLRVVRAACAVVMLALVGIVTFLLVPAKAQEGRNDPLIVKSAGPISLHNGESAIIGVLLPAVQRGRLPYRLQLFDGSGKMLVEAPIRAERATTAAFVDVFFGDGSVRVVDRANADGQTLFEGTSDGSIIAVLLPAVQRDGTRMSALSASVQIFNADHQRGQIVGMCDGSVRLP